MLKGHFSSLIPECIAAIVILQTYIIYLNPIYDYVLGPVAYYHKVGSNQLDGPINDHKIPPTK